VSTRFPGWTKWNPAWWLKNADDVPPPGYTPLAWWLRNPSHNLMWYVLGCNDRWHKTLELFTGAGWHVHLVIDPYRPVWIAGLCWLLGGPWWLLLVLALGPYVSWEAAGGGTFAYLGWREGGELGASLRRSR